MEHLLSRVVGRVSLPGKNDLNGLPSVIKNVKSGRHSTP
ncbi:conserved hypothetical protein [delta proteobacterium NaphS2]|nr:conserved hypothetical protein [delta proteobacterium NaphS2]